MRITAKIILKIAVIIAILTLNPISGFAQTDYYYTENWEITDFHSEIYLNEDGTVDITENIQADFTNESHRGIARMIPYLYESDYQDYNARINFKSATNENLEPWSVYDYHENGYLNIEMTTHDDSQITETATFIINYIAENVILHFPDPIDNIPPHDEFYWNVNGTEWVVPIQNTSANVHLPKIFDEEELLIDCFTGGYGENNKDCEYQVIGDTIRFRATKPFNPYENLTIVVGLPTGTLATPSLAKQAWWFVSANAGLLLAPITLLIMLFLWFVRGRDEKTARDTIMPHYKPPKGLLPTETGTIIDEKLDPRDITATIIDFAIKGFIKIKEIERKKLIGKEKDYVLELIKPYKTDKKFEKEVLKAIFPTNEPGQKKKISALKNKFYTKISTIRSSVMKQLIDDGYFPHNPSTVKTIYTTIGGFILFGGFYLAFSPGNMIGLIISGLIIIIIGRFMPKKTQKGAETYYQLKGLYEYIDTAEKDRMKFQEEQNILFEKLLPYAMAFGIAKKWAKAFDGLIKEPPAWFSPHRPWSDHPFTMGYLAGRLDSFGSKFTNNIVTRPGGHGGGGGAWSGSSGFGGGGFSGGGFGGGGGRGL